MGVLNTPPGQTVPGPPLCWIWMRKSGNSWSCFCLSLLGCKKSQELLVTLGSSPCPSLILLSLTLNVSPPFCYPALSCYLAHQCLSPLSVFISILLPEPQPSPFHGHSQAAASLSALPRSPSPLFYLDSCWPKIASPSICPFSGGGCARDFGSRN